MSDISIGKFSSDYSGGKYLQGGKYEELKRQYQKFLKQAEKSDMQNSLTFKQKQLELLQQLKKAAVEESNYADYDMIDDEIEFLESVIAYEQKQATKQEIRDYVPPIMPAKPQNDMLSLLKACKNLNGEIDNETRRIVLAFKDSDVSPRGLSKFVDKCRGIGEVISSETVQSIEKLREASVSPSLIFEAVDENPVLIDSEVGKIDFSWVDDMLTYKSLGIGERDSLKFSKRLNGDYENKEKVFSSAVKMLEAGFDADKTANIISSFSVTNSETGKKNLSVKSINSVLGMKKALSSSHSVERNERRNPINTSGQFLLESGDTVFVMKDDKVVEVIETGEKSYNKVLRQYDEVASILENNIISDFVKTYKTKDGNIDPNALRVFSVLRGAGVSYEHLLSLVEASLNEVPEDKELGVEKHYEINADKVNTITTLKKSGALSSDILTILSSLTQDKNGKYLDKDIQSACYLTELIIPGREVAELVPEVSNDYQVKDFVADFSSVVEVKKFLLPLVQLTKDTNGKFDEDAAEVLYSLSERFLQNDEDNMRESVFLSNAEKVVEASKSPVTANVDENCLNVCIAMCRNNESIDNILKGLEICRDEYGYPSESLCDIIWDMSKQNACFTDIVDLINLCKPVNGILDIERASVIADLFDNNYSVNEVMNFAKDLGKN